VAKYCELSSSRRDEPLSLSPQQRRKTEEKKMWKLKVELKVETVRVLQRIE
jgi:hypothetical protein